MDIFQATILPKLRQDLKIYAGNHEFDGSPTWMIYDPLSDNYFKIGWFEFECLKRFDGAKTDNDLIKIVNEETTLNIESEDVQELIMFMAQAGLFQGDNPHIQEILKYRMSKKEASFLHKYFLGYIFINIPLFRPEKFLKASFPYISFMFTRTFMLVILSLLGVGLYLTIHRWDDFLNTFTAFFSFENVATIIAATIIIKIFHELGHAYMANKYNVRVPTMGVILIVLYPILFTETTNAWRLYERKKRLHIAAAGLMAELCLATIALLIWHISSPGMIQNLSYFIAFISFMLSVFINANPLMKFDGHFLLADTLAIDNLQTRSARFFNWSLRETLFALGEDAPENIPQDKARFLTIFGFAQAIYKWFLYAGIAVALYYFVPKPFGFILSVILLSIMLGLPICKELYSWLKKRGEIMTNKRASITFCAFFLVIIVFFLPFSNTIKVPAVLHYKNYKPLYVSSPAHIDAINVQNLQTVSNGDVLFETSSDLLELQIMQARQNIQKYRTILARQNTSPELSRQNVEIEQSIKSWETKLKGLLEEKKELQITAPFDGVIKDIPSSLHEGRWVNPEQILAQIVSTQELQVTGYLNADDIERLKQGASAEFKSNSKLFQSYTLKLQEISKQETKNIAHAELSSTYGGSIAASRNQTKITAQKPLYILKFSIDKENHEIIDTKQKGTVVLNVQPTSFAAKIFARVISIFLRETSV